MAQVFENIGAGEGNRTLDTQLGKLRRRTQVADIHDELLYKDFQIFPFHPRFCTTRWILGADQSHREVIQLALSDSAGLAAVAGRRGKGVVMS